MNAWTLEAVFLLPVFAFLASFAAKDLLHARHLATAAFAGTAVLTLVLGARHAHVSVPLPWAQSGALFTFGPARVPFLVATAFTATALIVSAPASTLTVTSLRRTLLGFVAVSLAYLSTDFLLQALTSSTIAYVTYADVSATARTRTARGEARLTAILLGGSSLVALAGALVAVFGPSHGAGGALFDAFARDQSSHLAAMVIAPIAVSMIVRLAPFPFHGWLTTSLERGSIGPMAMALLSQPAAMMALHAAMPRVRGDGEGLPSWSIWASGVFIAAGALSALAALAQSDLRRALGYVVSSQNALALAGLVTGTLEGGVAAVLFSLAISVTMVALVFISYSIETRAGKVDAHARLGFAKSWPRIGAVFLLLALGTIGFPGSVQFFAEDLLLQGLLEAHPYAAYAVLVVAVLNGVTLLRLFIGLFFGLGHRRSANEYVAPDLRLRELAGPAAMVGLLLGLVVIVPTLGALIER